MKKCFFAVLIGLMLLSQAIAPYFVNAEIRPGYAVSHPAQVLPSRGVSTVQKTVYPAAQKVSQAPALTTVGGHLYFAGVQPTLGQSGIVPSQQIVSYHEPVYLFYSGAAIPLPSPRWEEFCPQDFIKAQAAGSVSANSSDQLLASVTGTSSIFTRRAAQDKLQTYWALRRNEFEQGLETCQANAGTEGNCYLNLRKQEEAKNDAYRQAQRPVAQSILVPFARCSSNGSGGYFCY